MVCCVVSRRKPGLILVLKPAEPMRASSDMNHAATSMRWTPGWVLLVSILAPASAWSLHTVGPDLVPGYIGVLCWLTLTPERRPRWMSIRATVVEPALLASAASAVAAQPTTALSLAASVNTESNVTGEKEVGKAKKPRAKARKPKAVTLAEMKSLTGGADRAVVWSQVGPGKFVRQPGEENAEGEGEEFAESAPANMVIEAVATSSAVMDDGDE